MSDKRPILEMKNIAKRFGQFYALKDVSLTVYPGEVHSLMGENGAGKSTLMKILAGAYTATAGEIFIDDKPYILEDTYFVAGLVKDLTEDIIHHSIYDHIRDTLGLKIGGAYRKIHADRSNELDWQELACDQHTPILEVEQVVYLTNGTPFEYSTARSRFDTRSYTITDIIKQ